MDLLIPNRSRKYGYIYWRKENDLDIRQLLNSAKHIEVLLEGRPLGRKEVDWKFRRISLGYKQTRSLGKSVTRFRLVVDDDGRLRVKCL